jgi:hypothetical protein
MIKGNELVKRSVRKELIQDSCCAHKQTKRAQQVELWPNFRCGSCCTRATKKTPWPSGLITRILKINEKALQRTRWNDQFVSLGSLSSGRSALFQYFVKMFCEPRFVLFLLVSKFLWTERSWREVLNKRVWKGLNSILWSKPLIYLEVDWLWEWVVENRICYQWGDLLDGMDWVYLHSQVRWTDIDIWSA